MSGPKQGAIALGPFSFTPDEEFLPTIDPAEIELGLEIAALEERHHFGSINSDETLKLQESLDGSRKMAEALAELETRLAESPEEARKWAILCFAFRCIRAGFTAGQRFAEREG